MWGAMSIVHMYRAVARVTVFVAAFLLAPPTGSAEIFRLSTDDVPPLASPDMSGLHNRLTVEAFRRLDHDVRISMLPSERALIDAANGDDDGTLPRIAGLDAAYPTLIQVPEKIMDYHFTAFTLVGAPPVSSWEDLRPRSVGYVLGWKIFEQHTQNSPQVTKAHTPEQLFTLLARGQIDVALLEHWQGLHTAKKLGLRDVRANLPPLAVREMFIYLNRRNADLAPRLADAIRAMRADGTYQRIENDVLAPLNGPSESTR